MVDYDFFEKYQRIIVWIFNTRFGRRYFKIHNEQYSSLPSYKKIIAVFPNAIRWDNNDGSVSTELRTNNRFVRDMNRVLKLVPFIQWNREFNWTPQLAFGLTVSPFFPDPHVESTSVDGNAGFEDGAAGTKSWTELVDNAGNFAADSSALDNVLSIRATNQTDKWRNNRRGVFLFTRLVIVIIEKLFF